jgi:hypothetical protein
MLVTFEMLVEGLVRGEKLIENERRKRDEQKASQKEGRRQTWPTPQSGK